MSKKLDNLPLSNMDKLRITAANDKALRDRLLASPAEVLKEHGIDVPDGVEVKAVADDMKTHHVVVPPFVGADLDEKSLAAVQASSNGTTWCTTCTATTPICAGSLASLTCA